MVGLNWPIPKIYDQLTSQNGTAIKRRNNRGFGGRNGSVDAPLARLRLCRAEWTRTENKS